MPRPKGLPKTGGRVAGTPNKLNSRSVEQLDLFLANKFPGMLKRFERLNDKDAWDVYLRLLSFRVPRLSMISLEMVYSLLPEKHLDALLKIESIDGEEGEN